MLWRAALTVGLIWGAVYCLSRLHAVITAIVVGSIMAYIIRPIAGWMISKKLFHLVHRTNNHHTRRFIATAYVLVLLFAAIYGAGKIVVTPFIKEAQHLVTNYPALQEKWTKTAADAKDWYEKTTPPGTRKGFHEKVLYPISRVDLDIKAKAPFRGHDALQVLANPLQINVHVVL